MAGRRALPQGRLLMALRRSFSRKGRNGAVTAVAVITATRCGICRAAERRLSRDRVPGRRLVLLEIRRTMATIMVRDSILGCTGCGPI